MDTTTLALITTAIVGIFGGLITCLLAVVAFFVVRWIKSQEGGQARLEKVLSSLQLTIHDFGADLKRLAKDVEDHDLILGRLGKVRGCTQDGCPFYDQDATPIPRTVRTRLTDQQEG